MMIKMVIFLSCQAGLAVIDRPLTIDLVRNYDKLGTVLARSPPMWEPGTTHGYHALTYGLYASHLLTRADPKRRTIGQFFQDEIAKPFGKSSYRVMLNPFVVITYNIVMLIMYSISIQFVLILWVHLTTYTVLYLIITVEAERG